MISKSRTNVILMTFRVEKLNANMYIVTSCKMVFILIHFVVKTEQKMCLISLLINANYILTNFVVKPSNTKSLICYR